MKKPDNPHPQCLDIDGAVARYGLWDVPARKETRTVRLYCMDGQSDEFIIQCRKNVGDASIGAWDCIEAEDLGLNNYVSWDTQDTAWLAGYTMEQECPGGLALTGAENGEWFWFCPVASLTKMADGGKVIGINIYTARQFYDFRPGKCNREAKWLRAHAESQLRAARSTLGGVRDSMGIPEKRGEEVCADMAGQVVSGTQSADERDR